MKILFNKEQEGEIREVLGISDADIEVAKVWPYLRTASREIYSIIGKENYEICEAEFAEPSENEENQELLDLVKYAVAGYGFKEWAKVADLSFTNNGRMFRRDDHSVGAFEWQINKSDAELDRAYYRALNEVMAFISDSDTLSSSDFILQFRGLYVPNLSEFQRYVHINDSHYLFFKLAPSLRLCEQREIIGRMGTRFQEYKKIKDSHIFTLIQNICVYFAMADGIQKYSVQLFPDGLMTGGSKSGSGYDKESASLYYRQQMEGLLKTLEVEIKKLQPVYTSRPRINFSDDDGFVTTS